jgi:hypothetical protein
MTLPIFCTLHNHGCCFLDNYDTGDQLCDKLGLYRTS